MNPLGGDNPLIAAAEREAATLATLWTRPGEYVASRHRVAAARGADGEVSRHPGEHVGGRCPVRYGTCGSIRWPWTPYGCGASRT